MRISDWSSDVCSSDLVGLLVANDFKSALIRADLQEADTGNPEKAQIFYQQVMTSLGNIRGRFESKTNYLYQLKGNHPPFKKDDQEITRASSRERGCTYV